MVIQYMSERRVSFGLQWELVDDMIEAEGWILVVLLRLSPIVPWNLLNIAMATTRIHFLSFFLASAIGVRLKTLRCLKPHVLKVYNGVHVISLFPMPGKLLLCTLRGVGHPFSFHTGLYHTFLEYQTLVCSNKLFAHCRHCFFRARFQFSFALRS